MEILGLCSYPLEAACTRYRLIQFVEPLAEKNINLTILPFLEKDEFANLYKSGRTAGKAVQLLNSARKRLVDVLKRRKFDALLIQREAMLFGPPVFEWLYITIRNCPLVLDLDDATYLSYVSPTYGRLGSALKFFGKTDKLIDWSETVICGNRRIAEYVEGRGRKAVVVPTVVDTDKFYPLEKNESEPPIIGWIGTHSTFPMLEKIFPVLQNLAREFEFRLKIVGAGRDKIELDGVKIENLGWTLEREIADFQSLDIGLYPLEIVESVSEEWLAGKSGFKAIQYMSVGIPFVVTPVGVTAELGIENQTHYAAISHADWYQSLKNLLESAELRNRMGKAGRKYALENFTVPRQAEIISRVLRRAVEEFNLNKRNRKTHKNG